MKQFFKNVLMYVASLIVLFVPVYFISSVAGGSFDIHFWAENVRQGALTVLIVLGSCITIVFLFKVILENFDL
jgi:hypothetical protein